LRAGPLLGFDIALHTMTLLRPTTIAVAALSLFLSGLAVAAKRQGATEGLPMTKSTRRTAR
jgi:hypothetical protein